MVYSSYLPASVARLVLAKNVMIRLHDVLSFIHAHNHIHHYTCIIVLIIIIMLIRATVPPSKI